MKSFRSLLRAGVLLASMTPLSVWAAAPNAASPQVAPPQPAVTGGLGEFLVARFAERNGDMDTAATYALRGLSEEINGVQLRQAYLDCVLAGRPEAADLAGKLADDPLAALLLANRDATSDHWDAASRRFAAMPDKRRSLAAILQPLLVAWAQAGDKQSDQALATLRRYVDDSHHGVYALNAAMIADLAGDTADADRYYKKARAAYPTLNLRMAYILASWYSRSGHPKEANEVIDQLAAAMPQLSVAIPAIRANLAKPPVPDAKAGLAEAYLALAASLRDEAPSELSLVLLQYSIDLRPHFAAALLLKAEIEANRKWDDAALAALDQIDPADPLVAIAKLRKAGILQRQHKTDAAIATLNELIKAEPKDPLPLMQMGDILRETHKNDEAIKAYTQAINLIPNPSNIDWSLFYARAIAYDSAHDWPHALADLQTALKLSPDQPAAMNYLAYSWAERGEHLDEARQMAEKAVDSAPEEGAFIDTLGWIMFKQGDVPGALDKVQRAAEIATEDPVVNAHLGYVDEKAGHLLDAIYQWQSALRFDPSPSDATALHAKLKEALIELERQGGKPVK